MQSISAGGGRALPRDQTSRGVEAELVHMIVCIVLESPPGASPSSTPDGDSTLTFAPSSQVLVRTNHRAPRTDLYRRNIIVRAAHGFGTHALVVVRETRMAQSAVALNSVFPLYRTIAVIVDVRVPRLYRTVAVIVDVRDCLFLCVARRPV